ncbi:hypothetical protein [Roseomonas populi]|uniref:Uncharacterized protein n=1 Tax=Roseomonas populi TaxID=3121582 RepID=A0ABT1X0R6_9PROT|nr:hypothetical protein [Roseomonas pecuniae]MCR0981689.1 hypothetical protein [Roseomonas pecuniae]
MSAACSDTPVTLLPREVRLVVERILLLTTVPHGLIPAVRDVVLYSAAAGLGGLPLLRRRFGDLRMAETVAPSITEPAPGHLVVDARGGHAWVVLPMILDALGAATALEGAATAEVTNLRDPEELRTASAYAPREGLSVQVTGGAGDAAGTFILRAAPSTAGDAVLDRALREGVVVEPALWWDLHHLSNTALSTDTPESRRHAGPVIVEADGRITGRTDHDDDTDLSLLTSAKPESANAH